jgi:hypothetical protein
LIKQLLQLDPTWKAVLPLTLLYVVLGSLLLRFSPRFSGMLLITIPFILIFCRVHERATPFIISLPIPSRQIFLARVISILSVLWIPAIFSSLIFVLQGPRGPETATLLITATSLSTLAVFILQSMRVQEMGVPLRYIVLLFLIPQALLFWSVLGRRFPMEPVLTACLIVSAFLFILIWKRIPSSFQIAGPEATSIQLISSNTNWTSIAWRPILRSVFTFQYILALYLLFISQDIFYLPLILIFLPLLWINVCKHICWLGAFPIARRTILLFALIPMLISIEAGHLKRTYMHGFHETMNILPTQDWRSGAAEHYWGGMNNILPPLAFWEPVHSYKAPLIVAPWGETFQPPVFKLFGFRIYNPYAVGKDNSRRYFDWQFTKATTAAYGRALPQSEIKSAWISEYDHRLFFPIKFKIAYAAFNIGFVMILLSCIELFNLPFFQKFRKFIRIFGISFLILFFAALILFLIFVGNPVFYLNSLPLIISWSFPDNLLATIGVVIVLLGLIYWILDVLFRKAEYVDKPKESFFGLALSNLD